MLNLLDRESTGECQAKIFVAARWSLFETPNAEHPAVAYAQFDWTLIGERIRTRRALAATFPIICSNHASVTLRSGRAKTNRKRKLVSILK